jgi:hypothetical protein
MAILNSAKNLAKIGIKAKEGVKNGTKKAIKSSVINAKDKDGNIKKTLGNVYTGKKLNPIHVGVVGGVFLGGQYAKKSMGHNSIEPLKLATMNNYQEMGAPDVMMYDGVGQERAPKNLNANGSIVFGLHNSRKG